MKSVPNLVLASITALIVVLAVAAGIFASRDTVPSWPADSPEAVVQAYAEAVSEADYAAAIELLDPLMECKPENFARSYYPQDTTIALLQSHIGPDRATVTVEIGTYGEAFFEPFMGQEQFELIADDGGWLITGAPWPVYGCGGIL